MRQTGYIFLMASLTVFWACDKGTQTDESALNSSFYEQQKKKTSNQDGDLSKVDDKDEVIIATDKKDPVKIDNQIELGLGGVQVKSFDVLKSSIESCFATDQMTKITNDMLISPGSSGGDVPDSEGRIRFLMPSEGLEAGADVLEFERDTLLGSRDDARSNVKADSMTAVYLRSIALVGNVVAHNCNESIAACSCDTEEKARVVIEQCLPAVVPKGDMFEETVRMFSVECAKGKFESRKAIASLISSYAFAEGR